MMPERRTSENERAATLFTTPASVTKTIDEASSAAPFGTGNIEVTFDGDVIEWWCTDCNEAGRISDWQGSKWDNRQ